MKKFLLLIILFTGTVFSSYSQSWQWIKDGGSNNVLPLGGGDRPEEVYSIVTDSEKNIYTLSAVGQSNLNIDGNPKTYYGDNSTLTDYAISSFTCNGSYRWSKIIGGGNRETINSIQIDAFDNLYVAGQFSTCSFNTLYPPRIENDVIITQNPQDCSLLFIAKFDKNGLMQWFKRPQETTVPQTISLSQTTSRGFVTDESGNSYWLVSLPAGNYANGAFTATLPGNQPGSPLYIFKYDPNGNFVSGTYLDMQLTYDFQLELKFHRNPYNGYFYFSSMRYDNSATGVIAGQTVIHSAFITCFNDLGQFQWKKENTDTNGGMLTFYNLDFDNQNNIYMAGKMIGASMDTFLGFSIPEFIGTSFVMKANPTADSMLWTTYNHDNGDPRTGAVVVHDNEVGFAGYCFGSNFIWGTQSIFASNTNEGTEVLLARFNATTGACIGLSKIPGDVGYEDTGAALAVDASGDYILGGSFGHYLYDVNSNFVINGGSQSDFFVAKYATSACSPLGIDDYDIEEIKIYPNPVSDIFTVSVKENTQFELYTITGIQITKGSLTEQQNSIDIQKMAAGCYLLHLKNKAGSIEVVKVLKN